MKKYIGAALIVLAILIGFFASRQLGLFSQKANVVTNHVSDTSSLNLPQGWNSVDSKDALLKLEKKTDKGVKPEIVLAKSTSKDAAKPAKYVDRLIAGARSTISTLTITSDKRQSEIGLYTANIAASYFNKKTKINILQRVYVKSETVYTLTASFTGDMSLEINQIFDMVVKQKVNL